MKLELKDRVALITGPAKGMGPAVARALAREGCKLVLCGRDVAAVSEFAASLDLPADTVHVQPCDVTQLSHCEAAAAEAIRRFGSIDILVNIAGGTGPIGKTGVETSDEEFQSIVDLNLNGCFHTIKSVAPHMIGQRYGKIVNIGGTFGLRGRAGRLGYSASKWGLRGLTKSFALELGPHNINVNCLAPGMVDGPRFREKVCKEMAERLQISVEKAVELHAGDYALRRISLDEDIANACLFLASDVSRQITGVDLPVDGGWAML